MSPSRCAQSALILLHVAALAMTIVPAPPDDLPVVGTVRRVAGTGRLSGLLTPVFDRVALEEQSLALAWYRATRPVRPASNRYLGVVTTAVGWWMFSNPSREDTYLRVRYYVERPNSGQGEFAVFDEIAFPTLPPRDRLRLTASFRSAYLDRSVDSCLTEFHRRLSLEERREADEALALVDRYYRQRFVAAWLAPGDRLRRVELWHGTAANNPPARGSDPETDRVMLLYPLQGPRPRRVPASETNRLFQNEDYGGVRWVLEHISVL